MQVRQPGRTGTPAGSGHRFTPGQRTYWQRGESPGFGDDSSHAWRKGWVCREGSQGRYGDVRQIQGRDRDMSLWRQQHPGSRCLVSGLARLTDADGRDVTHPDHAGFPGKRRHERQAKMTISDNTVAIIGTGNIGSRLAANFAAGGQDFLLADRDQETARKLASGLGGHAEVVTIDEAIDRADVLVFAVWPDPFKQLIAQYGQRLAGKVIIDPTNPVGPDGAGGYRKGIGEQESSGQILAGLLPAGAQLVKAFGTLSAPSLSAAARRQPARAGQFYATTDDAPGTLLPDTIPPGRHA